MTVIVRRNRSRRYMLRFLMVLDLLAAVLVCGFGAELLTIGTGAALFLLMTAPMAVLLFFHERWSVTFSRDGILWKGRLRPWTQVERVRESHSATDRQVISLHFRDGKTLRFRMEEENAEQARKMICCHFSIET